jgi:hypothetical protein
MAEKQPGLSITGSRANDTNHEERPVKEIGLQNRAERVHEFHEAEGYIIDINAEDTAKVSGLKLAKDGHTVLIPQPSDDKHDPLNWSWAKKHSILFVVSFVSFLPDYGSATGAVTLIPQAESVSVSLAVFV